jgi:ABC-type branched-subunit amino acid transport system permease subunit
MLRYPLYFALFILLLIFVGAASFAVGMVVGVDAVATGNYGQDITVAIVVAIVAAVLAVAISVLLVRRRGRDSRFL